MTTTLTPEQQSAVLYWPTEVGVPIIPCDSKVKEFNSQWKDVNFSKIDFGEKLAAGEYDNGVALVLGKTLSSELYSFSLDFDGWDAVEKFFGSWENVLLRSQKTRIEWHQNKGRIHVLFFSKVATNPLAKKKINIDNSLLEIRYDELLIASPSVHGDGNPWTVLGTQEIMILDEEKLFQLQAKIDSISQGYMSNEDKQRYIEWLEDPNTKLYENGGRHPALVTLGTSYLYRYANGWKNLTDDDRKARLWEWNEQHCIPPKPEKEFNDIWKWIIDHHRKNRDQQREEEERKRPFHLPECISYQTSSNPDLYIIGSADFKLIEVQRKLKIVDDEGGSGGGQLTEKIFTKRTFLACKPVRIIKHKNPLSFLELQPRFTIEFKGREPSGNFTIKQKTIAEIVSELKNGNALTDNGIDVAITAQIKAFEQRGILEENDDMAYTGFFTGESNKQIIYSNVKISTAIDIQKLREALEYIDQLARLGYQNRLDLLAHVIKFGVIAPCSFIFKVIKAPILGWPDFYGKPNASKTTSGRIALAIDGHHDDDNYNVNVAHVDSIARLGDTISQTTFPKLVDEMDFTDNKVLINNTKSAIDQPAAITKTISSM